jgi:O-antigen/teichoic acid export membrane protein
MKSPSSYFVQHIFWKGLFFLSGFMVNVLIARHFGPEGSGVNYYMMALFSFATLVLSGSYESAIVFFISRKEISANKLFGLSLVWILVSTTLLVLIGYAAFLCYPAYQSNNLWLYGLMFIIGNLMVGFMSSFSSANKDFKTPSLIGFIVNVLLMTAVALLLPSAWISPQQFWLLYFGGFFLQGIILLWILFRQGEGSPSSSLPNSTELKKILQYLLVVFVCNLIMFACYRLDYWFVHHYCSLSSLGNYIQVSKLVQLFFILPGILAGVVFPLTAGGNQAQSNDTIVLLSRVLFTFYLIGCIILATIGKWFFPWLFGENFTQMYAAFVCYIPGILFFSALFTLTAYFAGSGRVIVNLKGALIALILISAGDVLVIPIWGINGAAVISSIGYLSYFLYVMNIYTNEHSTSIWSFLIMNKGDLRYIGNLLQKRKTNTISDSK